MWKEAVVVYFKVLSRHVTGGTKENNKKISQDSRFQDRNLNPGLFEYEAGELTTFDMITFRSAQTRVKKLKHHNHKSFLTALHFETKFFEEL
jgi:hypothetical protein